RPVPKPVPQRPEGRRDASFRTSSQLDDGGHAAPPLPQPPVGPEQAGLAGGAGGADRDVGGGQSGTLQPADIGPLQIHLELLPAGEGMDKGLRLGPQSGPQSVGDIPVSLKTAAGDPRPDG